MGAMDLLRRPPHRPYANLFLAGAIGLFAGLAVESVVSGTSPHRSLGVLIGDPFALWLLTAPAMLAVVLCYGLPMLWLALRSRIAGPVPATVVAFLPGLAGIADGTRIGRTVLEVCVATALAFLVLAYRRREPAPDVAPG
jgi:hypothetical protein